MAAARLALSAEKGRASCLDTVLGKWLDLGDNIDKICVELQVGANVPNAAAMVPSRLTRVSIAASMYCKTPESALSKASFQASFQRLSPSINLKRTLCCKPPALPFGATAPRVRPVPHVLCAAVCKAGKFHEILKVGLKLHCNYTTPVITATSVSGGYP